MSLEDLKIVDYIFVGLDTIVILITLLYFISKGTTFKKCKNIIIDQRTLAIYRSFIYVNSSSGWLAAVFTFTFPSLIKLPFHWIFVGTIIYMLSISVPSYACKKLGHGGTCACDAYEYNDFLPMVFLTIFGILFLTFYDFQRYEVSYIIVPLIAMSIIIYKFLPKKIIKPLGYPPQLLMNTVDQYPNPFVLNNTIGR